MPKKKSIKKCKYYKINKAERNTIISICKEFGIGVKFEYKYKSYRGEYDFEKQTVYIYPKAIKTRKDLYSTLFHEISHYLLKDRFKVISYNCKFKKGCLCKYLQIANKLYYYEYLVDKNAERLFKKFKKKLNLDDFEFSYKNLKEYKEAYKQSAEELKDYIRTEYRKLYG